MLNNTLKQLKIFGKESLGILKAIKNDICQEISIQKQLRSYRKELVSKQTTSEIATTHAHEEPQN